MYNLVLGTGMGFPIPSSEQIKIMHGVGWEGAFVSCSPDHPPEQSAKALYECGMKFQSTHAPFNRVDKLWEEGDEGDDFTNVLIKCVENTAAVGVPLMIVHTIIGMEKCTPTEIGLPRFEKIVLAGEKHGVKIAFENTEGEEYLEYLLKHFASSDYAGFCIDTGHAHVSGIHVGSFIRMAGDRLKATHIDDNNRDGDTHLPPFMGTVDWADTMKAFKDINYQNDFSFELGSHRFPTSTRATWCKFIHDLGVDLMNMM